ncbi:MAG: 2OG-Fe(II) oxygenase [Acidimicrobiaceae bacterium]|nr:2OG-Fe(II) oxygenase [Acidimicrobiaceae bacterium]
MELLVDLDRHPVHRPGTAAYDELFERCCADLAAHGMFDLEGFLRPAAIERAVHELRPLVDHDSFLHAREHNVWFLPADEAAATHGLDLGHPSLATMLTANRTVCADQMAGAVVMAVYEWAPLRAFVAATVGAAELHPMADPLARVNVMSYRDGEALQWHFDRARFTTTLLLQRPLAGGRFEWRHGLRSADGVDHDGLGEVIAGTDASVDHRDVRAGTLNVFAGHDTVHRVAPVHGEVDRLIAVYSWAEQAGVTFTDAERIGFYGRA